MANRKRLNENTSPKKGGKKSKQGPEKVDELCVTCKKNAENDVVECQWCSKWEHWECGGLNSDEYNMLSSCSDKIMFFCTQCYSKVPFALKVETTTSHQYQEQQNIDKRLQVVESKIKELTQDLKTQLDKHHQLLSTTFTRCVKHCYIPRNYK